MYEAPKLERFGAFRELTLQGYGKLIIGDDAIPGVGLDCDDTVAPGSPTSCIQRS